jgi:hypothetical protein
MRFSCLAQRQALSPHFTAPSDAKESASERRPQQWWCMPNSVPLSTGDHQHRLLGLAP